MVLYKHTAIGKAKGKKNYGKISSLLSIQRTSGTAYSWNNYQPAEPEKLKNK